jgi:Tfp pilus assembly protein PilO
MTEQIRDTFYKNIGAIVGVLIPVIMAIIIWAFTQSNTLAVHTERLSSQDKEIEKCKESRNIVRANIDDIKDKMSDMREDIREALVILKKRP